MDLTSISPYLTRLSLGVPTPDPTFVPDESRRKASYLINKAMLILALYFLLRITRASKCFKHLLSIDAVIKWARQL